MRNLMKLVAVVAVVSMMAGLAVAAEHKGQISRTDNNGTSASRGLLDCSGVVEIESVGWDLQILPTISNVDDYLDLGFNIWTGGELVFHYTFPASDFGWEWAFTFSHNIDGSSVTALWAYDGCGEEFVINGNFGDAATGTGGTGDTAAGGAELWVILDGEYGTGGILIVPDFIFQEVIPIEPASFCDEIVDVTGVGLFSGDTCGGGQTEGAGTGPGCVLIPPSDTFYVQDGLESYYGVFMPAGSSFEAHLIHTCDASMRVMDACLEPLNCIGYMDYYWSGNPPEGEETLPFTNDTGADMMVYLIVDSYDDCCGTYDLDFSSTTGAIANEEMSLGEVKALYR